MAQNSRLDIGKKRDQGVDVGSMISAPLVAASAANTDMMRHQAKFLMDFCFNKSDVKNEKGEIVDYQYAPRMIEMFMKKSVMSHDENHDPTFNTEEFSFQVPVLTLIPINSLAVDDIKVQFDMEIISQTTQTYESTDGGQKNTEQRAQLLGKISSDSSSSSNSSKRNSSKLHVEVHAGPLPLPVGVNAILEMYAKAILPIPKKNPNNPKHS